jgi:hypothetical protein
MCDFAATNNVAVWLSNPTEQPHVSPAHRSRQSNSTPTMFFFSHHFPVGEVAGLPAVAVGHPAVPSHLPLVLL